MPARGRRTKMRLAKGRMGQPNGLSPSMRLPAIRQLDTPVPLKEIEYMIIDTSCYPTNLVDLAWRHDGEPFSGERLIEGDGRAVLHQRQTSSHRQGVYSTAARQHHLYVDRWRTLGPRVDRRLHGVHRGNGSEVPGPLIGCFVYNPRCGPETARKRSNSTSKEHGFKMVQLQANMMRTAPTARSTGCAPRW